MTLYELLLSMQAENQSQWRDYGRAPPDDWLLKRIPDREICRQTLCDATGMSDSWGVSKLAEWVDKGIVSFYRIGRLQTKLYNKTAKAKRIERKANEKDGKAA